MSPATYSDWQNPRSNPLADKIILITNGAGDSKFAQDVREEIRQCGCACEILPGDVFDSSQLRTLVQDLLNRLHHIDAIFDDSAIARDLVIRRLTDEEWLAQ